MIITVQPDMLKKIQGYKSISIGAYNIAQVYSFSIEGREAFKCSGVPNI